jgi:hypothetical protein
MIVLRIHGALLLATLVALTGCGTATSEPDYDPTAMLTNSTPFMSPGIDRPPAISADEATVSDEVEVIGVTADGQSRAYLISAMTGMTTHIANDLLGDVPVSVTYCDRTDFARAFTGSENGQLVDLGLQGWVDGEMSLLVNSQGFRHSDVDIPLQDFPFERTTWGEWKQKHPDTTLVTTLQPASQQLPPSDAPGPSGPGGPPAMPPSGAD